MSAQDIAEIVASGFELSALRTVLRRNFESAQASGTQYDWKPLLNELKPLVMADKLPTELSPLQVALANSFDVSILGTHAASHLAVQPDVVCKGAIEHLAEIRTILASEGPLTKETIPHCRELNIFPTPPAWAPPALKAQGGACKNVVCSVPTGTPVLSQEIRVDGPQRLMSRHGASALHATGTSEGVSVYATRFCFRYWVGEDSKIHSGTIYVSDFTALSPDSPDWSLRAVHTPTYFVGKETALADFLDTSSTFGLMPTMEYWEAMKKQGYITMPSSEEGAAAV